MNDIPRPETEYLLTRAEQESVLSLGSNHPQAALAHYNLALLYGERARVALRDGFDPMWARVEASVSTGIE